jgi:hypothetical protein
MEQEEVAIMNKQYKSCTPEEREKQIQFLKEKLTRIMGSKGSPEAQTVLGKGTWRGAYRRVAFESHSDDGHEA